MARRRKTQVKAEEIKSHVYDPFRDFEGTQFELLVSKIFYFLRTHKRNVIIGLSIVSAAIVISTSWLIYRDMQETESLHAFEELMTQPVMKGEGKEAAELALRKLNDYEGTYTIARAHQRSRIKKIELLTSLDRLKDAGDTAMAVAEDAETPELKAYFTFKAGALYESAGLNESCNTAYERSITYFTDENIMKAQAMFGQARCLFGLGKNQEGKQALKTMMEMKDVAGIEEVRTLAASFMISRRGR